ncbi:P-II family nitrogen regulator [Candidatus Sumerlaeota bacterium]|nr:P-II family nitrogen regulator [Candidatus Sumerlaeota bacterium]MBI3735683.1 P-II family nitrogen regulator [Candidatus Sumerlaeota bacterium]
MSTPHPIEENLKEIYLIVRPEEKYDVERGLKGVVAPIYCTWSGLGRGTQGGLAYEEQDARRWWSWWKRTPRSALLPKIILYLVVPENKVEPVLNAVGAALRLKSGPADCGLGVGFILPIEQELAITPGRKIQPGVLPRQEISINGSTQNGAELEEVAI